MKGGFVILRAGVLHCAALFLVCLWLIPTLGLLLTSFRDQGAIATSGWWSVLTPTEHVLQLRAPSLVPTPDRAPDLVRQDGVGWIQHGNLFDGQAGEVSAFGLTATAPKAALAGQTLAHRRGHQVNVNKNGDFTITYPTDPRGQRGQRIFISTRQAPNLTLDNYREVLLAQGMGRSFLNTLMVTLPGTLLPVLIAAFAAYALAWMKVPGRALLIAGIAALLVVPLQAAFIPLLRLYNGVGLGKSYLGIWLAHTGFGLPIAIFLLHNAMARLPRDMIESARMDGASDLQIFRSIVLPLAFPALASLMIFQFLWVWNDLLVARVFLGHGEDELVMTGRMIELIGSHGGNWEVLAASAFVSLVVPLAVFFLLQRFLLRGLLAGSMR